MNKFYIATKFQNADRFHQVRIYLESLGYTITYDWTNATVSDMAQAKSDLEGVKAADFVIGIFEEDYQYKGAIAEIGMALALDKPVFILGNWLDGMIFMQLPFVFKIDEINQIKSPEYFKHVFKQYPPGYIEQSRESGEHDVVMDAIKEHIEGD